MLPEKTLVDILLDHIEHLGSRHVFNFLENGERLTRRSTFSEFTHQASRVAHWLQSRQMAGQRVVLVFEPGIEFVEAYLGCLMAGAVAVPVAPMAGARTDQRSSKTQAIIEDCAPALILGTSATLEPLQLTLASCLESTAAPSIQDYGKVDWGHNTGPLNERPKPGDLAMLQYTSGSTSLPKGVMLTHRNVLHNIAHFDEYWNHDQDSRLVNWLPHFHDLGLLYGLLFPLYKGIEAYLLPPAAVVQKPVRWLRAISEFRGTHSMGPNFMYELCAHRIDEKDLAGLDLSSWRMSLNAAEPVRSETWRRFNERFKHVGLSPSTVTGGYGLAEAACRVTAAHAKSPMTVLRLGVDALGLNQVLVEPEPGVRSIDVVGCGYPALDTELQIVATKDFTACGPLSVGEVWVRSGSVATGYWRRPEQSQSTFGGIRADDPAQRPYLRTGDLGFVHEGELFLTGRIKDLVIIRGENYYPHDIEKTVEGAHPALRRGCCAVFSVTTEDSEGLALVQEIQKGTAASDLETIHAAIRQAVARAHDLPIECISLIEAGTIDKTSSGKIQRSAVRAAYLEKRLALLDQWHRQAAPAAPSPAGLARPEGHHRIKAFLRERIAALTGVPLASIDDRAPFADLGLGSLEATQLSAELANQLGMDVSPTLFYDHPNIRALADGMSATEPVGTAAHRPGGADEIAVIGMACRFPQANNPDEFWRLLLEGGQAISEREGRNGERRPGGFLPDIASFEHRFFSISKREADALDPQQRLALEVSWEALENASILPASLSGTNTGVFFGASSFDYGAMQLSEGMLDAYTGQGSVLGVIANRLSYFYDLRGPSFVIDTACSSSLTSLHLACNSLRLGECDMALSGGVNALLADEWNVALGMAGMLSPDGQCKTFDAQANGYVRGEGCGVVVLKRYQDAVRDGDHVYGVILSTAINQDGRSNGLTAPNGKAQESLLREGLRRAGVSADELGYIEAHGTGTPLGDPIECNSLRRVLGDRTQPCLLGSVKGNIGHLEAAAGMAGLIKTLLCISEQVVPRQVNLSQLNPLIDLGNSLSIPDQTMPWKRTSGKRRHASVSAFGFSGTNANAILAEPAMACTPQSRAGVSGALPFVLSGSNPAAIARAAAQYLSKMGSAQDNAWLDFAHGACCKRSDKGLRVAFVAESEGMCMERLQAIAHGGSMRSEPPLDKPTIAFVFSGQGIPLVPVGRELHARLPAFRAAIDQCDALLRPRLKRSLIEMMSGDDPVLEAHEPGMVQPVQFALQYALAKSLQAFGLKPDLVAGHSLGEYAAWCIAGAIGLEDAMRLVIARGQLTQERCPQGAMVSIQAAATDVALWIERAGVLLDLAVVNGRSQCVVAGAPDDVQAFCRRTLDQHDVTWIPLPVQRAYHSRLIEPACAPFKEVADTVDYLVPHTRVISNLDGKFWPSDCAPHANYLVDHLRGAVRFDWCLDTLAEEKNLICIEVGTKPVISRSAAIHLGDKGPRWTATLRHDGEDWFALLQCLADVHTAGGELSWDTAFEGLGARSRPMPGYPFAGEHHWFTSREVSATEGTPRHTVLREPRAEYTLADDSAPSSAAEGTGAVEDQLKTMLARLLKCTPSELDSHRTFFHLGVDSIVLVEFARLVGQAFGLTLRIHELASKTPTISHLASHIESCMAALPSSKPPATFNK